MFRFADVPVSLSGMTRIQGKKIFPTKYLFPLKQTVEEFVTCNDTSYATQARNHP